MTDPFPTSPRKFAVVDWGSRKINRNKICAECWTGAAFGPYWLLTERLRYETTPLLPSLRDRVHVHDRRDDAHSGHSGSHPVSDDRRAAGAGRRHSQRRRQGRGRRQRKRARSKQRDKQQHRHPRKHNPNRPRGRQHSRRRGHTKHHCRRRRSHTRQHRRNRQLRRHPHPIPPHANRRHARGNLHHVTNRLRPLRHRKPKRRHLHRLVERRPRGHRDDLPRNPGQRLVPGQGAHGRTHLLGRRQPGKRLRPVAPGMGQLLQPGHRGPRLFL